VSTTGIPIPDPGAPGTTTDPTTTTPAPDGACPPDEDADDDNNPWDPASPNFDPDCPPPITDPNTSCEFGFVFDVEANDGEGDCVPCPENMDDPLFDPMNCPAPETITTEEEDLTAQPDQGATAGPTITDEPTEGCNPLFEVCLEGDSGGGSGDEDDDDG
jgi:hypothetical protein